MSQVKSISDQIGGHVEKSGRSSISSQRAKTQQPDIADIFIIGGGVNGCGIARDAAGRGLSVTLAEAGDLAQATSSSSTKLFHGGLRYLEYLELRLVREALKERETLLQMMPHISWPMRFVLPYHTDQRFETDTPVARLLAKLFPWMKGKRPAWLIRLGLFLYDHIGGGDILPATRKLFLSDDPAGVPLLDKFQMAFEYSDCWVDDARLVVLNACDAHDRGATILTRSRVTKARCEDGLWVISVQDVETGEDHDYHARFLVNAGGPWVQDIVDKISRQRAREFVRLVRGSHIVTKRIFLHDKCYFFQGADGRIIFAIPYETDFTLIGTTDLDHSDLHVSPRCSDEELDYLCNFASQYFKEPVKAKDVVWSFSGVRPLFDDGASTASSTTREYVLKLETDAGAPLLNIIGGKLTIYRRLAENVLELISPYFPMMQASWTDEVPLPGGDFPVEDFSNLVGALQERYPFLESDWAYRLARTYGTKVAEMLGDATCIEDLGRMFGATLSECEVRWLIEHEFARTAEDIVWRRTKLGLKLSKAQIVTLDDWVKKL